jgi:uncharacterized protein YprB with RNaseH-like and TPR domain
MKLSRKTREALSNLMTASRALQSKEGICPEGRVSVEEYLPGGVQDGKSGQIYVHEKLHSDVETNTRRIVSLYRRAELNAFSAELEGRAKELETLGKTGFSKAVFLDIESTGLFNCPTFLIGIMFLSENDFVIRQLFARDYSEEKCLIETISDVLSGFETVITFNGKSYDIPFIADRAIYHGTGFVNHLFHFDLLHHSRRHWKGVLPNCKLQTLELHVCGRRRVGDIPGSEIPNVYHTFVRTGDPYLMVPIFHHNVLDLITMSELLIEVMSREGLIKKRQKTGETEAM